MHLETGKRLTTATSFVKKKKKKKLETNAHKQENEYMIINCDIPMQSQITKQ